MEGLDFGALDRLTEEEEEEGEGLGGGEGRGASVARGQEV